MMADTDFGRIKRNISKMIDLGAPEADIDAYLSHENVTPDQLRSAPSAAPVQAPAPAAPEVPTATGLQAPIQAADDILRMMAKGAAMGKTATPEDAYDRAQAVSEIGRRFARGRVQQQPQMTLPEYQQQFEAEKQALADAEKRSGIAGTAAEVIGSLAPAAAIGGAVNLGARAAAGLPVAGRVASNPFVQAGAAGAGLGAVDALGTDKDMTTNLALGAGAGVIGQGVANLIGAGVSKAAGLVNKAPAIPTRAAIEDAKNTAYKAADDAGVIYTPQMMGRIGAGVKSELTDMAYLPANQPRIANVINELDRVGQGNVSLKGLDALRKAASGAYDPANRESNAMISKIIRNIDDAVANPKSGDVLMGDAVKGAEAIAQGRAMHARGAKLDRIEEALKKAENRTATTGSGGNIDNATRQELRKILEKPRGFSPDEKAALETAVKGTGVQNLLRLAGKLSPSGNGLMAALQVGAAGATGGASVPLAMLGIGAKSASDSATRKNVEALAKIIAAGGSRAATQAPKNRIQRLAESKRQALARALAVAPFAQ